MKKALTDFISYSHINLTWFGINFLLCSMPGFAIWMSNPALELKDTTKTYLPIVITLLAMHIIAFGAKIFIYSRVEPKAAEKSDDADKQVLDEVAGS